MSTAIRDAYDRVARARTGSLLSNGRTVNEQLTYLVKLRSELLKFLEAVEQATAEQQRLIARRREAEKS